MSVAVPGATEDLRLNCAGEKAKKLSVRDGAIHLDSRILLSVGSLGSLECQPFLGKALAISFFLMVNKRKANLFRAAWGLLQIHPNNHQLGGIA